MWNQECFLQSMYQLLLFFNHFDFECNFVIIHRYMAERVYASIDQPYEMTNAISDTEIM